MRHPGCAVADVPSLVGRLPTITQPCSSTTSAVVSPTPPGQGPGSVGALRVANRLTWPSGASSTMVVPVPCRFVESLKLLIRMWPARRLPTVRLTCAMPYGLTSPFPGTVEAMVLIVLSGGSSACSSAANAVAESSIDKANDVHASLAASLVWAFMLFPLLFERLPAAVTAVSGARAPTGSGSARYRACRRGSGGRLAQGIEQQPGELRPGARFLVLEVHVHVATGGGVLADQLCPASQVRGRVTLVAQPEVAVAGGDLQRCGEFFAVGDAQGDVARAQPREHLAVHPRGMAELERRAQLHRQQRQELVEHGEILAEPGRQLEEDRAELGAECGRGIKKVLQHRRAVTQLGDEIG